MENWKTYQIDLLKKTFSVKDWPGDKTKMGGRGFASHWISENTPPTCDPLGAENDLIFTIGLLGGSGASSSNRLSVAGKSPLTGGIKESNTGGRAGYDFGLLGIRALILQGLSDTWLKIVINKDGIHFLPAGGLLGKDIYTIVREIREEHGQKMDVIAIGPAGEMQMAAASIGINDNDGIPARHAARGGLAAVMGSKRVKAIILDTAGSKVPEPFDKDALKAATKRFAQALLDNPTTSTTMPKYGTSVIVNVVNNLGGLPTRNFSEGVFEGAEKISGDALYDLIVARGGKPTHACMPGCVIRCSNVVPDKEGGELNRALEYETITLLGSNCGIDDLDTINRLNKRCDEIGIDTIETGAAIAVAMEAGLASFGDGDAALKFMDEIEQGTELGRILGSGAQATGEAYGVTRIPVVKRQAMAAYDPRALKGTGVTYATTPMGADHTAGNALPNTKLPDGRVPDTTKKEDQAELSAFLQRLSAAFDALGLCWFTRAPVFGDYSLITDMIHAMHGETYSTNDLFEMGKAILQDELDFNRRAGLTQKDDLPAFFRTEPLPPHGYVFDVDQDELDRVHLMDIKVE